MRQRVPNIRLSRVKISRVAFYEFFVGQIHREIFTAVLISAWWRDCCCWHAGGVFGVVRQGGDAHAEVSALSRSGQCSRVQRILLERAARLSRPSRRTQRRLELIPRSRLSLFISGKTAENVFFFSPHRINAFTTVTYAEKLEMANILCRT